jgi:hypothetical protein
MGSGGGWPSEPWTRSTPTIRTGRPRPSLRQPQDYKAGRVTESQAIDRMAELMAYEPDNEAGQNKQELLEAEYGRIGEKENAN